jgi:hypothetical protein
MSRLQETIPGQILETNLAYNIPEKITNIYIYIELLLYIYIILPCGGRYADKIALRDTFPESP